MPEFDFTNYYNDLSYSTPINPRGNSNRVLRESSWADTLAGFGGDPSSMAGSDFINNMSSGGWNDRKAALASNYLASQEFQAEMNYNTQMSNTQYQRGVADMQAAGVNPALLYGGHGSSTTAPTISGPAPTAQGTNPMAKIGSLLGGLESLGSLANLVANASLTKARAAEIWQNIEKSKADARKSNADAEGQEKTNKYIDERQQAEIDKIYAESDKLNAETVLTELMGDKVIAETEDIYKDIELKDHQISKIDAEKALIDAQKFGQDIDNWVNDMTKNEQVRFARLNNALTEAKTEEAKQSARRNLAEAIGQEYKNWYMASFGTDVPDGQWVAIASFIAHGITGLSDPDHPDSFQLSPHELAGTVMNIPAYIVQSFIDAIVGVWKKK